MQLVLMTPCTCAWVGLCAIHRHLALITHTCEGESMKRS